MVVLECLQSGIYDGACWSVFFIASIETWTGKGKSASSETLFWDQEVNTVYHYWVVGIAAWSSGILKIQLKLRAADTQQLKKKKPQTTQPKSQMSKETKNPKALKVLLICSWFCWLMKTQNSSSKKQEDNVMCCARSDRWKISGN